MLETTHRFAHERRRVTQIPLCVLDVNVAEERAQHGETAFGILVGSIPVDQGRCGEAVTAMSPET